MPEKTKTTSDASESQTKAAPEATPEPPAPKTAPKREHPGFGAAGSGRRGKEEPES